MVQFFYYFQRVLLECFVLFSHFGANDEIISCDEILEINHSNQFANKICLC